MTLAIACPEDRQLQSILQGLAAPEVLEAFAVHLEKCSECALRLDRSLDGDTLMDAMRSQSTVTDSPNDPEVQVLVNRLLQIRLTARPQPERSHDMTAEIGNSTPEMDTKQEWDFLGARHHGDGSGRGRLAKGAAGLQDHGRRGSRQAGTRGMSSGREGLPVGPPSRGGPSFHV